MTRRHALTDAAWAKLGPLLPTNDRRGHPFKDHRLVIDAIRWVLSAGAAWRDLPERFGPWPTGCGRFSRWRKDGTRDRIAAELPARSEVAADLWCVDRTTGRASRPAAGARSRAAAG